MPKLLTDVPFDTKLPVAHISSLSSLGILSITTLLFGIAFTIIGPFAVVGVRKELTPNKVAPSTPGIVESMIKSENQHVRNLGVVLVIVVFVTALALTPLGLIAIWFGWAWISVWISVWQGKEAMSASDTYPPDDDAEPDPRTPPFICPNCGQKRLYVEKRHSVQPVRCPSCMAALTPYSKLSTLNQQTPA